MKKGCFLRHNKLITEKQTIIAIREFNNNMNNERNKYELAKDTDGRKAKNTLFSMLAALLQVR